MDGEQTRGVTPRLRLPLLVAAMAAIFLLDLANPGVEVIPFACAPVLVAAGFCGVWDTVLTAGLLLAMTVADAVSTPTDASGNNWLLAGAQVCVAAGAVVLALTRDRDRRRSRAAQRARAESEARYRLLAENATDVVYSTGSDGRVTWVSPSVESELGWRPDELVGQLMSEITHPDDLQAVGAIRDDIYAASRPDVARDFLVRVRRKDGSWVWAYGTGRAIHDADGNAVGAIVGARNVDDLVAARETIRLDRDFLRAIVDSLMDPQVTLGAVRDEAGNLVDLVVNSGNEAARRYFDTPSEGVEEPGDGDAPERSDGLLGYPVSQWVPGGVESRLFGLLAGVLESGQPLSIRGFQVDTAEAGWGSRFYDLQAVPFGDGLLATWRDVTNDRQAALELEESRERYRLLAENASDIVYRTDGRGIVQWVSPSVLDVLGWGTDEVVGRSGFELVHPEDVAELRQEQALAVAEGFAGSVEPATPVRFLRKDATVRWMQIRVRSIRDGSGAVTSSVIGLRDVTDEYAATQALAHQAFHDPLTGLRNRAWILDSLESDLRGAAREHAGVAVFFVDLDNFKVINDSLGHAAGDEVLSTIGRRIAAGLRPGDRVGRFGGDEFVVVIPEVEAPHEAEVIAERIMAEITQPLTVRGHTLVPTASMGVAISTPDSSAGDLLRDADAALFGAKADGRARWRFFDNDMHVEVVNRLTLESEIREGLGRAEFQVFYQPLVGLDDLVVQGYEALVRWAHPTRGLLGAATFLKAAEDSALIVEIGNEVLDQVCRRLAAEPDLPGRISVNVSAVQLGRPGWVQGFLETVERHGVDPSRLVVEVTETAVLALPARTVADLQLVRDLGVGIHVDDFGTGFSSISVLRDLPVTGLKLDASFVRGLTESDSPANALAAGLIGLAQGLNLLSIAEGIEHPSQFELLRAQGWVQGQGFLFGRAEAQPVRRLAGAMV